MGENYRKKTASAFGFAGRPMIARFHFGQKTLHDPARRHAGSDALLGLSIVLAALLSNTAAGAMPASNLQLSEYQKQDWQVEDGLPENDVRMIAQRPDGTLLLASSSGIASFDGQHFRALPINDPAKAAGDSDVEAVNAILPVGNDELWIGTDGRGLLHQTATGTVNVSEQAGFFNERIRMLHMDRSGVLWAALRRTVSSVLCMAGWRGFQARGWSPATSPHRLPRTATAACSSLPPRGSFIGGKALLSAMHCGYLDRILLLPSTGILSDEFGLALQGMSSSLFPEIQRRMQRRSSIR